MCERLYGRTLVNMPPFAVLLVASCPVGAAIDGLVSDLEFAGFNLVDITPYPRLTWFDRTNQGMLHLLEMLRRMLVFRRVAAAYVSADKTQSQVNPSVSHFHALFADVRFGCFNFDLIEVRASVVHIGVARKYSFSGQVTSVILRKANRNEKEALSASQ